MTQESVKMIRPCPACQGKGIIDDPHCQECGQRIESTDPWWKTDDDLLPCGHPAAALVETTTCPACGGDGRYPQWVSISEWQTLRRRKIVTGIILLIVLLLPVAAVLAAVADAYPGYVCGSWWYGLILIGVFFTDLGYDFYPGTGDRFPGHPQLDVTIHEHPTLRHFDPEQAHFVVAVSGRPETFTVTHPWMGPHQFRVCAGRIYIDDRKQKRVEAFSFGGTLQIKPNYNRTVCSLTSTAPIFDMVDLDSLSTAFSTEVEVLLAERRADWDPKHPYTFEQHLATAVPLELYACCLVELHKKFAPHLEHFDHVHHQLVSFATGEMKYLQRTGQWPAVVPPLTEIL